jgi:hypothetical protein
MPCLSAFCADLALPSSVFGPLDLAPLRRLASARTLDTGAAARDAAPALDMAGFLAGWWGLEGRGGGPGVWAGSVSILEYRNIVQELVKIRKLSRLFKRSVPRR